MTPGELDRLPVGSVVIADDVDGDRVAFTRRDATVFAWLSFGQKNYTSGEIADTADVVFVPFHDVLGEIRREAAADALAALADDDFPGWTDWQRAYLRDRAAQVSGKVA